MNLNLEEFNPDNIEFQLNQETSDFHKNSANILTQTLWNQAENNDKFILQILKTFYSKIHHYNKILLTEYEKC